MHRVTLGNSGLSVSPICFGTWQLSPRFWGEQPKEVVVAAMRRAFEVGVDFYDTADAYGEGYAETVVGEALSVLPRDAIVVATKVYHHFYPDGHRHGDLSRDYVLAECDASLKRLRMDYIDLYQCHAFDPLAPLSETADAMEALKRAGKIRAYGLSNFTVEQTRLALECGDFTTMQPKYHLMDRGAEDDLLPLCKASGVGVLVYSPLANGLLTGKYSGTETFSDFRKRNPAFQGERFKELAARVRSLLPIAKQYGMTITQLVLAVTLANPLIDCAIVGVKKPAHIEEAAAVMGKAISREDFYKVRQMLGTI